MPSKGRPPKPNVCMEPGCTQPRLQSGKTRLPRCHAHQQALWRSQPTSRPNKNRKRTEANAAKKAAWIKNTPDNTVLFRRQNATPQSFTTTRDNPRNARPPNYNFNPQFEVSDRALATERRKMNQACRIPTPQSTASNELIVAKPNPHLLLYAKMARLRIGEGWNNATAEEINRSMAEAPGW